MIDITKRLAQFAVEYVDKFDSTPDIVALEGEPTISCIDSPQIDSMTGRTEDLSIQEADARFEEWFAFCTEKEMSKDILYLVDCKMKILGIENETN